MMITDNLGLNYDVSGNLIITIPKSYIQNTEQDIFLKSINQLISLAIKKENIAEGWLGDSAADVVGICKSDINDGSVNHDRDIYGLK
jgi:hypothetical protein